MVKKILTEYFTGVRFNGDSLLCVLFFRFCHNRLGFLSALRRKKDSESKSDHADGKCFCESYEYVTTLRVPKYFEQNENVELDPVPFLSHFFRLLSATFGHFRLDKIKPNGTEHRAEDSRRGRQNTSASPLLSNHSKSKLVNSIIRT